ncbi:helix-turn-helix domain-containing protein [Streptomyces indicus]|uniref:Helix-turn-helix domain-containing protein n=1 Tax=Streptomyces indicus TaxID=417292 RepID=A0A1G9HJM3_9ACTN|nr:helix-turn-helix transcriptional regulator [Streptomyces indicus]SDL12944.1 Helix-turn-helix domain-containing protein [Streptomyces indicus]
MSARKRPQKNASVMKMVGAQVACLRQAAGLTQRDLAERVLVAETTVASIEQGRRALMPDLARSVDQLLGTGGVLAAAVANMPEVDLFPLWAEQYIQHEREAISLSWYDCVVMPGLLQTEDCVRAVLRNRVPAYDEDEIAAKTAARMDRQEILHRKVPPTLSFVVWEPVLRLGFCDEPTREGQLRHMLECAQLPGLSLQILPLDAPAHAGLNGAFTLLETPHHQHLAYTESQRGSHWVSDADGVSILARKYAMLRSQAVSPEASRGLLSRLLGER